MQKCKNVSLCYTLSRRVFSMFRREICFTVTAANRENELAALLIDDEYFIDPEGNVGHPKLVRTYLVFT